MNNTSKVAVCFIVGLAFGVVPILAYVLMLVAAVQLVATYGLAAKIVYGIVVSVIWGVAFAPFALRMGTFQFMVGFAEAAKFFGLKDTVRDSSGNPIPAEDSK